MRAKLYEDTYGGSTMNKLAQKDYEKCIYLAPHRHYYYKKLSVVKSYFGDKVGEKVDLNKAIKLIKIDIQKLNEKYEILELNYTLFHYYLDIDDYESAKMLLNSIYSQVKNEITLNCKMIEIIIDYNNFNNIESKNIETKTWTFIKNGVQINCNVEDIHNAKWLAMALVPKYQKFKKYCTGFDTKNIFEK